MRPGDCAVEHRSRLKRRDTGNHRFRAGGTVAGDLGVEPHTDDDQALQPVELVDRVEDQPLAAPGVYVTSHIAPILVLLLGRLVVARRAGMGAEVRRGALRAYQSEGPAREALRQSGLEHGPKAVPKVLVGHNQRDPIVQTESREGGRNVLQRTADMLGICGVEGVAARLVTLHIEEERLQRRTGSLVVALRQQLLLTSKLERHGPGDDALAAAHHFRQVDLLEAGRVVDAPPVRLRGI
mmetsp:Transcript_15892/g.45911  ORF Transcript_15892/g.45911 Transcript_15892/m.45911 type:complete len:239 (+) Transcript_15892:625-1341(+)